MQGWSAPIPTSEKVAYINALLEVGFDTIDFGSFVSPKAIPQMADTVEVLRQLDLSRSRSRLLAIIANLRGAKEASAYEVITYLGYPFSVSETFQQRNTGAGVDDSYRQLAEIVNTARGANKIPVVYISMGFGNPYGDPYHEELVYQWVSRIRDLGVSIISLADTVGLATPEQVASLTGHLISALPDITFGVHLHSGPQQREAKLRAALTAGCLRFDGALRGIGGCPMAGDALVGNLDTEWMVRFMEQEGYATGLDADKLAEAATRATALFLNPSDISHS